MKGIIQKDASVIAEDKSIHWLPIRGTDDEGYPKVLIYAKEIGHGGAFGSQSIKPFIGMTTEFTLIGNSACNFEIKKQ